MVMRLGITVSTAVALLATLTTCSTQPAIAQDANPQGNTQPSCTTLRGVLPAPHSVVATQTPLTVTGFMSCAQDAKVSLDIDGKLVEGTQVTPDRVQATIDSLSPGVHTVRLRANTTTVKEWPILVAGQSVKRVSGANRAATAVAVADQLVTTWGSTWSASPRAIVINGEREADAIPATTLAQVIHAPILVTGTDQVPEETRAWLGAHPGIELVVIGGEGVVSPTALSQLVTMSPKVSRLAGDTRYATAASVAKDLVTNHSITKLVLTDAGRWTDALPSAVYAARNQAALLLTDPTQAAEPAKALLNDHPTLREQVEVTGTTITDDVVTSLNGGTPVQRISEPVQPPMAMPTVGQAQPTTGALSVALAGRGSEQPTQSLVFTSATNPIDGITAGPLAAQTDGLILADTYGAGVLTMVIQQRSKLNTNAITVVGGPAAVSPETVANILGIGIDAKTTQDLQLPTGTFNNGQIAFTWNQPLTGGSIYIQDANGFEVPGTGTIAGNTITWKPNANISLANPLTATVFVVDAQHARHRVMSGEVLVPKKDKNGWDIAPGTGPVIGQSGRLYTWVAAVEPSTKWTIADWTALAERVLNDKRGWTHDGKVRLQRIDDPEKADIRLVLATPPTVDAQCARAGLNTGGRLSCWNNSNAMVNLDRINTGVPTFNDLEVYRTYVISHEFGHGLGHHHQTAPCSDPNQPAPVMMQQSINLRGCKPNGWPFPQA
ncbi:DUF3152 domain-containing protein [Stomatohabitans albus]|uniref:DUF3152 domain-containing protein n=1 Tax=Stomatohabitans albus TaxID=3110766 RepID=UPI00300D84FB